MRYPSGLRAAHWIIAALFAALAASGLLYSQEIVGSDALVFHQWCGQLLLVFVVLWIGVRLTSKIGPPNPNHAGWERVLATLVKNALYGLLIAYVVTGYVTASGLRSPELLFPVNAAFARSDLGETFLEIHFALKWALLAVLALHVLGALKHSLIDRDDTLRNMWFTKKG